MTGISEPTYLLALLCTADISVCHEPLRDPLRFSSIKSCEAASVQLDREALERGRIAYSSCVSGDHQDLAEIPGWWLPTVHSMKADAARSPRTHVAYRFGGAAPETGVYDKEVADISEEAQLDTGTTGSIRRVPEWQESVAASTIDADSLPEDVSHVRVVGYSGGQISVRNHLVPASR